MKMLTKLATPLMGLVLLLAWSGIAYLFATGQTPVPATVILVFLTVAFVCYALAARNPEIDGERIRDAHADQRYRSSKHDPDNFSRDKTGLGNHMDWGP